MSEPTDNAPSVGIIAQDPARQARARALAERWGLPLGPSQPFQLVLGGERLELWDAGGSAQQPLAVDFLHGAIDHRRRFGGGKGQSIAKAVGLHKGGAPTVLDATGGLARDAFVLATLGCSVTVVERVVPVAALVDDALQRAADDAEVGPIIARMRLVHADAVQFMAEIPATERPDVVYLDPMFPPRRKSAQVKKEMQVLQRLTEGLDDADALLPAALAVARVRVVVKRPGYAPWLAERQPTLSIETRKHRFDVYVIKALPG